MSAAVIGIAVPCALTVLVAQHTVMKMENRSVLVPLLSPFLKDIVDPLTLSSLLCLRLVMLLWLDVQSISIVFLANLN